MNDSARFICAIQPELKYMTTSCIRHDLEIFTYTGDIGTTCAISTERKSNLKNWPIYKQKKSELNVIISKKLV